MNEQSGYDQNQPGTHPGPSYGPQQQPQPSYTPVGQPEPPMGQPTPMAQPNPSAGGALPPSNRSGPDHATTGNRRRGPVLIIASLALAAVVGAGAGVGSYAFLDSGQQTSPITVTGSQAPQKQQQDGSVEDAASTIAPSVVTITVRSGNSGGVGSGVVLDKQGHILTNAHVVSGTDSSQRLPFGDASTAEADITVTLKNGTTASASVVGVDETDDLAVIKVDGVQDLQPATFAESDSLQPGQTVVAVGAPLGLSQTVTSGIVSNTTRPVRSGSGDEAVYLGVQTDASINQGNSGGPLVDLNGSVVGINSAMLSESSSQGQSSGSIGIGFAIPADVAVRVADDLIQSGESADARLGVTVQGDENGMLASSTAGVALQSVEPGSAAAKAGLQQGDVVTRINDYPVTTADGLIAATRYYAPGTSVQVGYERDGQQQTTKVTLGST